MSKSDPVGTLELLGQEYRYVIDGEYVHLYVSDDEVISVPAGLRWYAELERTALQRILDGLARDGYQLPDGRSASQLNSSPPKTRSSHRPPADS